MNSIYISSIKNKKATPLYCHVSHFAPLPTGHGGQHRTYQLLYEMQERLKNSHIFNLTNVQLVDPNRKQQLRPIRFPVRFIRSIKSTLTGNQNLSSKEKMLAPANDNWIQSIFDKKNLGVEKLIAIVEHPCFIPVIKNAFGETIVVWAFPHNIETIDSYDTSKESLLSECFQINQSSLAEELDALQQADQCYAISKVEAALLNSIGIHCDIFPYYPVGEIRKVSLNSRKLRNPVRNKFLLLGSASHQSTREGMVWLLEAIEKEPPKTNITIHVVGSQTDQLFPTRTIGNCLIKSHGFVSDSKLTELLGSCSAVLAPQFRGMGTLTKLAELSLSGVPVITGTHALSAVSAPPGIIGLRKKWREWKSLLEDSNAIPTASTLEDYNEWEQLLQKDSFPI